MRIFKKNIIVLIPLLISISSFAQPFKHKIDSLKAVIQFAASDSDRVNDWLGIVRAYSCKDSTIKVNAAKQALEIAEKIEWGKGRVTSLFTLGIIYAKCNQNYSESISYFEKGINIAKDNGDWNRMALGMGYIAHNHIAKANYQQAISCLRGALLLKIDTGIRIGIYSNIGETYSTLGIYKRALDYYDTAFQLVNTNEWTNNERIKTESKAALKITIAQTYLANGEFDQALANFNTSLGLCKVAKNPLGIILSLTGIGEAFQAAAQNEKAISYYNTALDKCREKGDTMGYMGERMVIYNHLGKLYIEQGMVAKALQYTQNALVLTKSNPSDKQVPVTFNIIGQIYTRLKEYDKALYYLNEAIRFCRESGMLDNEKDALYSLSVTYRQMNQPGKALDAYTNYIAIRDSLFSVDKAKAIVRHELTTDFNEKRARLQVEQDKKEAVQKAVLALTIKKQQFAYAAFSIIIILVIIVSVLLFNRSRLRKKLEMQMAVAAERNRISSEMHDDMGSELSKISLLSEVVKNNMDNSSSQSHLDNISKTSKELVDKMGEIVWSLSDKYDKLESLIIYIRRYAMEYFSGTEIDCKITTPEQIPDISLDGEMRRNIFLVVKEALHNALKHAGGDLVTLSIDINNNCINVKIWDNGKGLETKKNEFGNGMANMRKRVADINGTFTIENDNGTIIGFIIPLPILKQYP